MKDPTNGLIPGEPMKFPPDAKPADPQYKVTGTGSVMFTVPKDPANMTAEELAARIAELEAANTALRNADTEREMWFHKELKAVADKYNAAMADIQRINEAGRVLAREAARWWSDCSGESPSAYVECINNPTAAAWVREVSK